MVKYKIYSPNVEVRYNKEGHFLEGYFLKRWKVKVYACLKTWIRAIQKYLKSPTFEYKVSIFYKKFPIKVTQITCEKSGRIGLSVYNYLNLKKALNVYFNSIKELKIENANLIVVKSKDDVGVGSDLNKLVALRRKTALKKLDRRKFTDGFFVEKSILYE